MVLLWLSGCAPRLAVEADDTAEPDDTAVLIEGTAELALTPTTLAFGTVAPATSATLPLTLSSVGDADLTIEGLSLGFDAATDFSFDLGGLQSPFVLAPGSVATVEVTFSPTTPDRVEASLLVLSTDADASLVNVPLLGNDGGG